MGSDEIALPMLNEIICSYKEEINLVGVFTQPDRRSGRGMKLKQNRIKEWANENFIEVMQPDKIGCGEITWFHEINCQLIIVMAYGKILQQELLDIPKLGALNLHASILPKYRGASPIEAAIVSGDTETGVTLMKIIKKLDSGPILDCQKVVIEKIDTSTSLRKKIAISCVPLMKRNLEKILSGQSVYVDQDESVANYARIIVKEDGALDFSVSAKELYDRIRAFQTWPGCYFIFNNLKIKIGEADLIDDESEYRPGEVINNLNNSLLVGTGSGVICFLKLQKPSAKMMAASDFLRGHTIANGTILQSIPMQPLVSSSYFKPEIH